LADTGQSHSRNTTGIKFNKILWNCDMKQLQYPPAHLSWAIWGLGGLLYLIGFFHRVAPAVITHELSLDFDLDATALGSLSALYFYSYVLMQVPTGILADRWGTRKLLTTGALIAAAGGLLFALSTSFWWAGLGRFLVGGSVAVAYVCLLKISSRWLPVNRYALASAIALFLGIIGAVSAGTPMRWLVDGFGWRPIMSLIAAITLLVALLIAWFTRDDPVQKGYKSYALTTTAPTGETGFSLFASIKEVLSYRNIRLLCLIPGGIAGALLTFSGLWGVPFLTAHYALTAAEAASLCSIQLVAWSIGGLLIGWFCDRHGQLRRIYFVCCLLLLFFWAMILLIPALPILLLTLLLLLTGFFSGSIIVTFVFTRNSVPSALAGTASGLVNMAVMTGPMVLQPATGWVFDQLWTGTLVNGVRFFSRQTYSVGFSLLLIWLVVSVIATWFTREPVLVKT